MCLADCALDVGCNPDRHGHFLAPTTTTHRCQRQARNLTFSGSSTRHGVGPLTRDNRPSIGPITTSCRSSSVGTPRTRSVHPARHVSPNPACTLCLPRVPPSSLCSSTLRAATPCRRDGPRPPLHVARSATDEGEWLARELQALRTSRMIGQWADAVVLVRTRRQRRFIAHVLTAAGIPCRVQAPALAATPTIASGGGSDGRRRERRRSRQHRACVQGQ